MNRIAALLLIAMGFPLAYADDAVVGNGSAASCTTAAYNAAMQQLVDGPQARGGVLTFQCGAQPHTIAMDRPWNLTDGVLIDGAGLITLDGQNQHRFFQLFLLNQGQTEVTLRGIRLIRGFTSTDFGAAVYQRAGTRLTLERVTIADSRATTSGGAVAAETQTRLDIVDSDFLNNRAGDGGALAVRALTQITGSLFFGNRAEGILAEGGAIQSYEQPLSISDSVFEENSSARDGGAILKRGAVLTLERVSLLRNQATNRGAGVHSDGSTSVTANRIRAVANGGEGMYVEGGLTLTRGYFTRHVRIGVGFVTWAALTIRSGPSSALIEKSTFFSNVYGVRLERRVGADGVPGILRLDNVTSYGNVVASVDFDDEVGGVSGVQVFVDQSSLVEPNTHPFVGRGARVSFANSIVFGGLTPNCEQASGGPAAQFASTGNNLVGPGCPRVGSDGAEVQTLLQLQLSGLANHGGEVDTLMPELTSPAIDRRACVNVDARDRPRPVAAIPGGNVLCDIGAVERQAAETLGLLFRDGFEPE